MSNQWDDWDDWEDWQDWGEPNRYGFYGLNCKNRPSGTGTTHANRREARRNLQWDSLTKAAPDTEQSLASQAAALEKAAGKARKKLDEMKKKREDEEKEKEEEEEEEQASSSTNVNYRAPKKKKRHKSTKKTALEKAEGAEPALENSEAEGTIRRGRRAKHGQKELLRAKEEEEELPLEKGKKTKQDQDVSLEKDTKTQKKPTGSLEKDTKEDKTIGSLEKDTKKDQPTVSLEKDTKEAKPTGSLEKDTRRKDYKTPIMVVDWHNTIEKHDRVTFQNEKALNKLMDYAVVHILSYVETQWRGNEVHKQVKNLLSPSTRRKLKGVHCCYERVGLHGKLGWCRKLHASGIIDDNNDIINECRAEGLLCFAVVTRHCQHGNLPISMICDDLEQAVEAFLEI